MTAAHKYIIKLVANHIGLDQGAVEEFILDSERVSKQSFDVALISLVVSYG